MPIANREYERIRIAFAITELDVGGAERCLANLAIHLDRGRFHPIVYSLGPRPKAGRDGLVIALEGAGVPVEFVGTRSAMHFFRAVQRLRRLLTDQSPHVLQTFLFHANVVGLIAGHQASVRAITTGIRVADPSRWRWSVERRLASRAKRIVCVSQSVATFAQTKGGFPAEKLVVIPNGLDVCQFPATRSADLTQFGIRQDQTVIVAIGRLERQKGFDWLIQLSPRLFKVAPTCSLLILGDGPQRAQLQARAARLGVTHRIHFAGWQPNVPEILRSCHLFVLPSRWEGMPQALMEAMASAMPVVATRVDGVQELLGPLEVQQTVTFGDSDRFVDCVSRILHDRALANSLGHQNRSRIERLFSLERMVSDYQRLYESFV